MLFEKLMDVLYYNTSMTMSMYNTIAYLAIDIMSAYFVGSMLKKLINMINNLRDR